MGWGSFCRRCFIAMYRKFTHVDFEPAEMWMPVANTLMKSKNCVNLLLCPLQIVSAILNL